MCLADDALCQYCRKLAHGGNVILEHAADGDAGPVRDNGGNHWRRRQKPGNKRFDLNFLDCELIGVPGARIPKLPGRDCVWSFNEG